MHALGGVSSAIWPGETLGLVGESGSGKTTFARALLGIVEPTQGSVSLDGKRARADAREAHRRRRAGAPDRVPEPGLRAQPAPHGAAHPAPLAQAPGRASPAAPPTSASARSRAAVRLPDRAILQRPAQLSGGQKQRVAIARAFAGEPRLIVCDEPTSALDVSVQAAILNLLVELQSQRDTAYLFISHDLGVVRYLSDRIAVLYLGRLMELGTAETVFSGPHHPYTEALLSAVPTIDGEQRERIRLEGDIPSAADPPTGCVFHTRCPRKLGAICESEEPPLVEVEPAHHMRCHIPIEELRQLQLTRPGSAGGRRLIVGCSGAARRLWPRSARARRPGRGGARAGRPHRRHPGAGRARVGADAERRTAPRARRRALQRRAPAPRADRGPHPPEPGRAGGHARQPGARRAGAERLARSAPTRARRPIRWRPRSRPATSARCSSSSRCSIARTPTTRAC